MKGLEPAPLRLSRRMAELAGEEDMGWLGRYPWAFLCFEKGEYLCRYREVVPSLYVLLEGRVSVSITPPHGRTHIIVFCDPGNLVCGDVEVALGNTLATADLRAEGGRALCAALPIAPHRTELLQDAEFLRCALRRLSREMIHDSVCSANNLLFPLDERMAAYLLHASAEGLFSANLTHTAQLLGVSYRQLSRVMRSFAQRGWIVRTDEGWRLLDTNALTDFSAEIEALPER